jgi:hypothetical protein
MQDLFSLLKQSKDEYIETFEIRCNKFISEFEANKTDFIKKEIEYFKNTLYDIEYWEAAMDGFSITGIENCKIVETVVSKIGFEKFLYSTKNKIKFLVKENELTPILKEPKATQGLSLRQIALMYFYEGKQITRENGDSIAKQYGHNSGEKLFQHFTYYSATPNRIGKPSPFTQTKLKNKIDLFQSVVNLLPESKKQRAIDELIVLNTHYSNEFE